MRFSFSIIASGLFAVQAAAHVTRSIDDKIIVVRDTAKNKTQIDDATYQKLVHYAPFPNVAGQLATTTCANPPYGSKVVKYFNMNFTDTQAVLFRDDSAKEFILGVPGTASTEDYITDFLFVPIPYLSANVECLGCLVHLGFLNAWNSIADDVSATLNASLAQYPSYSTVISGHSLGGAIAQLAFGGLKPAFPSVKSAYTMGQPRVGNLAFAAYIDKLSGATDSDIGVFHRVTHYNDGVPQLPPELFGFVHSKTEFWESESVPNEATTYRCYGNEPADCNDAHGEGFINAAHTSYAGLQYNCSA